MTSPNVHAVFDKNTSNVTYVVSEPDSKDAIIIDPVLDYDALASQTSTSTVEKVIAHIEKNGLTLRAVVETHAHADHISAAQFLKSRYSVPVAIGAGIHLVQETFGAFFNLPASVPRDGSQFDLLLKAGEKYEFGKLEVLILATPGHTPACVSLHIGDAVFTGDSLFIEDYGTGRTDFPGGSARLLHQSVTKNLFTLPDATRVFVGHDYQPGGRELRVESTIGREKEANIQLSAATTESEFVSFRESRDATLSPPRLIYPSVQINVFGGFLPEPAENGKRYLRTPINTRVETDSSGSPVASGANS